MTTMEHAYNERKMKPSLRISITILIQMFQHAHKCNKKYKIEWELDRL